ncbi:MAG: hypothetical protein F9K40_16745, partial [Kofleriaceae bacterium]
MTTARAPRHVFRWDLDKTYLRTEFDSMRDLIKSAIETAADKQAYPGATALLRALRAGEGHRVCIISGSPSQMRTVLAAKLKLDGVEADEFVLKNNLKNILRGRKFLVAKRLVEMRRRRGKGYRSGGARREQPMSSNSL